MVYETDGIGNPRGSKRAGAVLGEILWMSTRRKERVNLIHVFSIEIMGFALRFAGAGRIRSKRVGERVWVCLRCQGRWNSAATGTAPFIFEYSTIVHFFCQNSCLLMFFSYISSYFVGEMGYQR